MRSGLTPSLSLFFFTIYYVLTHRIRIASYIKVRIPGEYLPFYEKLAVNIGISNGAKTELLQGLKEGDQVVLQ